MLRGSLEFGRDKSVIYHLMVTLIILLLGGGLGLFMGLFLGTLDNPITRDEMTGKQQFIYTAKQMGGRSWNSCKTFAVMGLVFSTAECVVEKINGSLARRAIKDLMAKGLIRMIFAHASQQIYTRATNA